MHISRLSQGSNPRSLESQATVLSTAPPGHIPLDWNYLLRLFRYILIWMKIAALPDRNRMEGRSYCLLFHRRPTQTRASLSSRYILLPASRGVLIIFAIHNYLWVGCGILSKFSCTINIRIRPHLHIPTRSFQIKHIPEALYPGFTLVRDHQ